jgi:outer membrane receptor protein involved in Fe transport
MPPSDRNAARCLATAVIGVAAVAAHAEEPSAQPSVPPTIVAQSNAAASLSSSDLEARGITTLDGVAAAMPEVSYAPTLNSLTALRLYMRGEGPAAPGQITLDGAVGLYQDGFYISRLQANTFDLLDLEHVDVLVGPQGATYGRDTTGTGS